jgi:multiple sugar transport system ATP-binding protein
MGAETLLWGRLGEDTLSIRVDTLQGLDEAKDIAIEIEPSLISLFDAETGQRL